jgi:hypothetical protein
MYPDLSYRHSIRQFLTFVVDSRNAYKYVHYLTLYHFRECVTNLLGVLRLLKPTIVSLTARLSVPITTYVGLHFFFNMYAL